MKKSDIFKGLRLMMDHHLSMTERLGPFYILAKLFTDLKGLVESVQFLIDLFNQFFN